MKMQLKDQQSGFTLIELIVVIVILGILAATAVPKFVDLQTDARNKAVSAAAGALTSASSINYATALVRGATNAAVVRLSTTGAGASLIAGQNAGFAADFATASDLNCGGSALGATGSVTLSHTGGTSANSAVATIICTG